MLGIIDVGGGMRGSFTAGIYDYILDQGVQPFDYLIGVSAGSGNMVSYLAGQRGRNIRFYLDYAFRREYMSMHNMLRTGSYINLDYPYTILSGPGGEDPVDLDIWFREQSGYAALLRTWLAAAGCWDRLLYGSDWPIVDPEKYLAFIRRLVPPEHWDAVFYENALRVYGL